MPKYRQCVQCVRDNIPTHNDLCQSSEVAEDDSDIYWRGGRYIESMEELKILR